MKLWDTLTIDNWLSILTILIALSGGILALCQWIKSEKLKRANFLNKIIEKLSFDSEMAQIRYLIEYDPDWYNEFFHDSKLEPVFDKYFFYLDYICYLIENKILNDEEITVLEYSIQRTCKNESCRAYFWNIYWFSKSNDCECSFQHLIKYGRERGWLIDNDFENKSSTIYPKYLMF